jgi:two-component system, sensor histidine kinase and response regulator
MNGETGPARILVVEDSMTQAHMMRTVLESDGFKVDVAPNGEVALEKHSDNDYQLVLSDVMMPGMSGYDLCRKIKSSGKEVPVVLVTALSELKDLVEGLRSGADNFITKPFEPNYLVSRVKAVISNNPAEGPSCDAETGICLMDNKFLRNLDKKKVLDYLVSTFDDYFRSRQREHDSKMIEAKVRLEIVEEREDFLTNLARDLQTPLICTDETLALLLDGAFGPVPSEQLEILRNLQNSNSAILMMVNEMVDAYRGTQPTLQPNKEPQSAPAQSARRAS